MNYVSCSVSKILKLTKSKLNTAGLQLASMAKLDCSRSVLVTDRAQNTVTWVAVLENNVQN